jgi:hypothetical protein
MFPIINPTGVPSEPETNRREKARLLVQEFRAKVGALLQEFRAKFGTNRTGRRYRRVMPAPQAKHNRKGGVQ